MSEPPRRPRPSPTPRSADAVPAAPPAPVSAVRPGPRPVLGDPACPELPPALGLQSGDALPRRVGPVLPGARTARSAGPARLVRAVATRRGARFASVTAIVAGTAVLVVSSSLTPLAGADTAARHHAHPAQVADRGLQFTDPALTTAPASSAPATPATTAPRRAHPTTSARMAPVDHSVISGLAANGIPSVALNAYRVAAARMANADPSCGIQWALIAGIGREESDHGQFGGAVLHADGISTPAIIGPPLNGKDGNRVIPAPANGLALDGDATYAHALGPMQFIPSTWAIYGLDADGDGTANIFDINDAALATARYLCAAGGDLTTRAGRVRAVFAYNHTNVYVAQVLALAHAYRTGTPITGLPQGNTSGSLPSLGKAGRIPPANPGAPTANKARAKAREKAREKARQRKAEQRRKARQRGKRLHNAPTSSPTQSPSKAPRPTRTPTRSPTKPRPSSSPSPSTSAPSPTSSSPSPSKSCLVICLP